MWQAWWATSSTTSCITTRLSIRNCAHRFGLALQKVNILRDVAHDVPAKRYYWPLGVMQRYRLNYGTLLHKEKRAAAMSVLREEVADATKYLHAGIQYVLALPKEQIGVRMFCLIPLFMAIESYIACTNNSDVFETDKTVKISREQVGEIVAKSGLWGKSNELLMKWYLACMCRMDAQAGRQEINLFCDFKLLTLHPLPCIRRSRGGRSTSSARRNRGRIARRRRCRRASPCRTDQAPSFRSLCPPCPDRRA